MQSAEIELKFPVAVPSDLEAMLPDLGFHLETPRTFEHNTLYDTPQRELRARHHLLRIRQYGSVYTLTHKRQPEGADDSIYKTRIETETTLADGDALAEIFGQLGYRPAFVYEKFRTEWSYSLYAQTKDFLENDRAHLVIDETPIGNWAELEGPTEWIDSMLSALKVDLSTRINDSYGKLFQVGKERTGSPATDLTFEQVGSALVTA